MIVVIVKKKKTGNKERRGSVGNEKKSRWQGTRHSCAFRRDLFRERYTDVSQPNGVLLIHGDASKCFFFSFRFHWNVFSYLDTTVDPTGGFFLLFPRCSRSVFNDTFWELFFIKRALIELRTNLRICEHRFGRVLESGRFYRLCVMLFLFSARLSQRECLLVDRTW